MIARAQQDFHRFVLSAIHTKESVRISALAEPHALTTLILEMASERSVLVRIYAGWTPDHSCLQWLSLFPVSMDWNEGSHKEYSLL